MATFTKSFDVNMDVQCSGGFWSEFNGIANVIKIEISIYDWEDSSSFEIGEVKAYHNIDAAKHGMPYTDKAFENAIEAKVNELLPTIVDGCICGSEAGMQGDDYWSGDIGFKDGLTANDVLQLGFKEQ